TAPSKSCGRRALSPSMSTGGTTARPSSTTTRPVYTVHADGALPPQDTIQFSNPDFRVRSLRSNAVLRREYRPGSTLFVVWTQSRHGDFGDPSFDLTRDLGRELLRDRPTNVLLVKLNYWLSR